MLQEAVAHAIVQATWSIEEAAYYVHNLDPASANKPPISLTAHNRPSQTFVWLKKEFENGRILSVAELDGIPRFSPGTLMRRLDEAKKLFQREVLRAYLRHGVLEGPSTCKDVAWNIYVRAAKLIHATYPTLRKTTVARLLTDLPSHLPIAPPLPAFGVDAIRNHLKDAWIGPNGRPKKGEDQSPEVDWKPIIEKLL